MARRCRSPSRHATEEPWSPRSRFRRRHPRRRASRNVEEAEAGLKRERVDLLFLDIQMPGGSGFDLLERLDRIPLVIFTTAFDQYAIRAFEVNALDYLMKPVAPERLAAALDRVRQRAGGASRGPLERVFVREGERCRIVNVADIRLLESE